MTGIKSATIVTEVTKENGQREEHKSSFDGFVIPGVSSRRRIRWSRVRREYPVGDLTDDELNALVAACKFRNDIYGHPDKGKLITVADRRDYNDPFFQNRQAFIDLQDASGTIRQDDPYQRIFSTFVKSNADPIWNVNNEGNLSLSGAKYSVVDTNSYISAGQQVRIKSQEAVKLLENLNDDKKIKIAMYLGLVPSENIDRQLVDDVLWKLCTSTADADDLKKDMFIELCKMSTERLSNRYLIAKARSRGFLKKTKEGFLLNGIRIGSVQSEVDIYFDDPNNQEVIAALEASINTRKK